MGAGGDHGYTDHCVEVDGQAKDFLDKYVRDGLRWPDLAPHGR
jgi:hypothetical protein